MCMKEKHSLVTDFAWYFSVLHNLVKLCTFSSGSTQIPIIADQLIEIALRVESVRPFAVECMASLVLDKSILETVQRDALSEV
jgi:AP-3 complex subunit delta-1